MEIGVRQAIANSADKARSLWPSRIDANRLEPQCWPELRPKFRFEPGCRVFTIGSCFAREIERALHDLGFDIPVFNFAHQHSKLLAGAGGINVLNRYTPPSIFQELSWTRTIMDRDDVVHPYDVEPLLLDAGHDRVYDLTRPIAPEFGMTREQAFEERRLLYGLYREAFLCNVVVITLGLIECWKDTQTGLYVEFSKGIIRSKDRFRFKRLDYVDSLDFIERAIALINRDHVAKILLTTSPVPLTRTFTRDDVIIANTYSKSVLRAVAGAISESRTDVDYFPSFESVMLTKSPQIWMDDLNHIEPSFVGSIMARVTESYVPDTAGNSSVLHDIYRFIGLIKAREWSAAQAVFKRIHLEEVPAGRGEFFPCAAELAAQLGDVDLVKAMAARTAEGLDPESQLQCAKALEAVGLNDLGSQRRILALKKGAETFVGLTQWVHILDHAGRREDLNWLLDNVESLIDLNSSTAWWLICIYEKVDRLEDRDRLLRQAHLVDPLNESIGLMLATRLIARGHEEEGLEVLRPIESRGSTSEYLHPLVQEHLRQARPFQAKALIARLVDANPEHPGLQYLARQCEAAVAACNAA